MMLYNPRNWHWIVAGDETRFWSSAAAAYVDTLPDGATPTRIANEVELYDVLASIGLAAKAPARTFTAAEVRAALLAVDAGATADATTAEELQGVATSIGMMLPPMEA